MRSSMGLSSAKRHCSALAIFPRLFTQLRTTLDLSARSAHSKISSATPSKQPSKPHVTKLAALPKSSASAAKPFSKNAKSTTYSKSACNTITSTLLPSVVILSGQPADFAFRPAFWDGQLVVEGSQRKMHGDASL